MQQILVRSSNILSVGYDKNSQILEIKFLSGGTYQYLNVPEYRYTGLMSAFSKGSYVANYIKPYYRYRRVYGY